MPPILSASLRLAPVFAAACGLYTAAALAEDKPFCIEFIDSVTGRGVPLVELLTVHGDRFVTDSAGRVAFQEPELMGREGYFTVRGHGFRLDNA